MCYQLPSDSLYRSAANTVIHIIRESGLMDAYFRWTDQYLHSYYKQLPSFDPPKASALTLKMLNGVFYVYLFGILLGALAFLAEFVGYSF